MIRGTAGVVFVCLFLCGFTRSQDVEYENRLPRSFLPYHYNLYLEPYLESQEPPFPLIGEVTIYFTCHQNSKILTLTSVDLTYDVNDVTITDLTSSTVDAPKLITIRFDKKKQFAYFDVDKDFKFDSNYTITIKYNGSIIANEAGMYAAPYLDNEGKTKYLAATQLETIGARTLFPGFDEVDMKATFDLVVSRAPNHTTLSNTHITSFYAGIKGRINDVFETTPRMTPYLLAVVVGELHYLESKVDHDVKYKVRTYTTEGMMPYIYHPNQHFTFPFQRWLEKETTVPYTLEKMDHIALYTFGGAMENWGLITYAEDILPVSNSTSTASGMFTSAYVVAHELSHMWYGNLVTCEWWTHLWLQEAMASYYNFYPLQAIGWQGSELHQLFGVLSYMELDQTNRSTPVRIVIKKPQDAVNAFAKSTYDKGGAMIRMLGQIMTLPVLKKALTSYLNQYKYNVANSDQFLQVFTDQAKKSNITYPDGSEINFKKLMDPWLDQKGFPILKVVDNNDETATVSQKRYFNPSNQVEDVASKYGYKWDVPILVLDEQSQPADYFKTPTYWLRASDKEIKIKIPKNGWYIINPDQKFYYKVWYDKKQRSLMSKNIHKLPTESRANIIDDTFGLSRNAYFEATDAYDNTLHLKTEQSYNVWSLTLNHVYDLEAFYTKETWYPKHNKYFMKHTDALLKNIKYEFELNETISETFLRRDAISAACWFGSETCLKYIRKKYEGYKANPALNLVNANILPTTLCDGVFYGEKEDWDLMGKEYTRRKHSPITEERLSLLYARTCANDNEYLRRIFEEVIKENGTFFNPLDRNRAAMYLASTPFGAATFWEFMDKNWSTFPTGIGKMSLVSVITESWHTLAELNELKAFIDRRQHLSINERSLFAYYVIRTEQNLDFYFHNINILGKWFDKHVPKAELKFKITDDRPIRMPDFKMWAAIGQDHADKFIARKRGRLGKLMEND